MNFQTSNAVIAASLKSRKIEKLMQPMLLSFALFAIILSLLLSSSASANVNEQTASKKQGMRIVALAPHIVEMLFDIGAGDKIVATVEYADYPEAALAIPRVGGYHGIKIEKILELKPDLVIAWQTGNAKSDLDKLERLGLNVTYSHPKNIEDVAKDLRRLGKLVGHEQQAEKVASAYDAKLKRLRQTYADKKPVPVFYQLWAEPLRTINKTTQINQLIEVCQGQNVFADNPTAYPKIGIENVIVAQPEIIIIPDEKTTRVQPVIEWHKWPEIPAAKNNKFISVNADLLHRFSTRMLSGIEEMCTKIDEVR